MKSNRKNSNFSPPSTLSYDPSSNPNTKRTKNTLHIGGIQVEFPYQPYGSQLAFMNRVISTLDRAVREGPSHALLESPTGTGKTLSLLCSALAWQQHRKCRNISSSLPLADSKPHPDAVADPIKHGGGFIPDTAPASSGDAGGVPSLPPNGPKKKAKLAPRIFYASRTHSQIRQVIQEFRKTDYRVPMAVLASRKHYCTNRTVRGTEDMDEQCKLLLKDTEAGCPEFKNVYKVTGHPSLQKGGCHEAHDIEDLVKIGEVAKGCSYFAARSMAENAELVFCPYNYIINPVIRKAMEVDIHGAVIILDEAHNVEDITRDAGSIDVEEDDLIQLEQELGQLSLTDPMVYQPLLDMVQEFLSWMNRRKSLLERRDFQHYFSCWTGDRALSELEDANMSLKCFPILQECATKAIKAASDAEPNVACLSGMATTVLEGLFSSFSFFFSENGIHASDYLLAIQRYVKKDKFSGAGWTHSLSLWCLNPAVVFSEITRLSLSVILTSGTLSPMSSFSSELGAHFGTFLEAPHVIDVESQLWAAVISKGPDGFPLNASYRTAEAYAFQDSLGSSLEQICSNVPGGCLVFFPSYKMMDKLCHRWQETGQWARLNAEKHLFIEPRGADQDGLEQVLKGYYNSIHKGSKPVAKIKKRAKKLDLKDQKSAESSQDAKTGAAFLAVCRGKISEGIDFSDDNARVVIIVGIPFPNVHDIKVAQKKKFNDAHKSSKNLLSGNEWYCHQAFRALNQATGRCIRHRFDYGGIILLDERYCEERNRVYLSKWFRKSIRLYDSFGKSIEELKSFFKDVKLNLCDHIGKVPRMPRQSEGEIEDISFSNDNKGTATQKNSRGINSYYPEVRLSSNSLVTQEDIFRQSDARHESIFCGGSRYAKQLMSKNERFYSGSIEYIDLECDAQNDSSWDRNLESTPSLCDPNLTIVRETPGSNGSPLVIESENYPRKEFSNMEVTPSVRETPGSNGSPLVIESENNPRKEFSNMEVTPSVSELPGNLSSSPMSVVNSSLGPRSIYVATTPERLVKIEGNDDIARTQSPYHLSVNSCSHKRRKSFNLLCESPDAIESGSPILRIPNCAPLFMDERLQISCLVCKTPLGLPSNDSFVTCSCISSSKVYLTSTWKDKMVSSDESTPGVPVIISDISCVNQHIFGKKDNVPKCNGVIPEGPGQGIWCKEDGCVYETIFCPFCSSSNTCLGVQVMATDAPNAWLQNKIMFFSSSLETKDPSASKDLEKEEKECSPSGDCTSKRAALSCIENFAYVPEEQASEGWRRRKSKMRLPRTGHLSATEG